MATRAYCDKKVAEKAATLAMSFKVIQDWPFLFVSYLSSYSIIIHKSASHTDGIISEEQLLKCYPILLGHSVSLRRSFKCSLSLLKS